MQNAMQQLSHKSEDEEFNPVANPYYPGANFSNSFGNFLLAQQENPELQSAGVLILTVRSVGKQFPPP